jgi:hypothetical protein
MIPTTTTRTTSPTTGTTARASAPGSSDRPVVVGNRAQLVAGGLAVLAAVGVAAGVGLVVRTGGTAADVVAPTNAAAPLYAVGDAAHGGPGSRADVIRDAPWAPASSAAAAALGETAHGGPGSRTDAVRSIVARPSVVRVADVAHGTAGSVVVTAAARA